MKPGKTLHFFSYDSVSNPWLGGGGATRDMEILARLRRNFDSIHLHVGYYPGAKKRIVQGVAVIPLGFGGKEILSRITYTLLANWRILFLGSEPFGIILSIYSPFLAAWVHRKRGFAVLHHIIGKHWMKKLGKAGWFLDRLESLYYRLPENFVVSNDAVADEILRKNPKANVLRSANSFDASLLDLEDASASGTPFILFLGRLDRYMKGLDILVEAFARIASRYPLLELVLAGRGDSESEKALRALAREQGLENRVLLRSSISDAEKKDLLSRCLFFCSPSRFEGFGIAALEANAAGKPAVVSQASGFRNSISDGFSGLLVDIEEKDQMENALLDLLDHPEKRKKMGRQARDWARQFTWDAIAEKEGRWLESVVWKGFNSQGPASA